MSRRVVCLAGFLHLVLAVLAAPLAFPAAEEDAQAVEIRGVVFLDADGNGRRDPGEPGMGDVAVSDGDAIITTRADGHYRIVTTTTIPNTVFAINPDGYVASGPFYHLVTEEASGLDFGLTPEPPLDDGGFSFYHAADWQFGDPIGAREEIEGDLAQLEAHASREDVRFYSFVGDITSHGALDHLRFFRSQFDALDRPFHALFGGHDGLVEMERPKMGNYVDVLGPYAYSWNYGGVHFIALVSEGYLSGVELERQMRWWQRDMERLPPDKPIVILAHTPDPLSQELVKVVEQYNVIAFLFGHWHTHHQYEVDGVPLFVSGPWRPLDWGAFTKRARVFTWSKGKLTSRTRVLGQDKRLVILEPGPVAGPGPLTVTTSVYDTVIAPESVAAVVESAVTNDSWEQPLEQIDDWTWRGAFPKALQPGEYLLRVKVTGHDGWSAERRFEVSEAPVEVNPTDDWPSVFGGHDGTRSSTSPIKPPLRLAWVTPLGSAQPFFSSPIIVDGKVYQGVADGQAGFSNAGVACVDARTGEPVWKTHLPRDVNSAICSDGARVYALDCQGTVYGLDSTTGERLWASDCYEGTGFHEENRFGWRTFLGPLAVNDGVVLAGGSRVLAAFDSRTCDRVWVDYNGLNRSAPYPVSGIAPLDGLGYFEDEGSVSAVSLATGAPAWVRPLKELFGNTSRERGAATPLVTDDGVYFHHRSHLRKLDPHTGEEQWGVRTGEGFNYVGIPAYGEGRVVVSTGGQIVAADAGTGEVAWKFATRSAEATKLGKYQHMLNGSAPVLANGYVFVGSDDGYLYTLSLADGTKVWEFNTGTPIKSSPAISGNLLVISNFAGQLMGFAGEME
jgi:outer membrane protein assembly factor BamB